MSLDPVALLRRYHATLEPYVAEEAAAMFAADAVYVSPGVNGRIEGRDAIIAAFTRYFAEHPDQKSVDESVEAVSPFEARASWRLEATARSTGTRVARRGTERIAFDASGLIRRVEVRDL